MIKNIIKAYPFTLREMKDEQFGNIRNQPDYSCTSKVSGKKKTLSPVLFQKKYTAGRPCKRTTESHWTKAKQKFPFYNQLNNLTKKLDV